MRLLFITNHYLFQNNGGANASKCFLHAFASLYDCCSLIYPEIETRSESFIPNNVSRFPCYDNRSLIRKGIDVYRGHLNRYEYFIPEHLKEHRYDIIVIDHSIVAAGTIHSIKASTSKIITIHHNVERDYVKDNTPMKALRLPFIHFVNKAELDTLKCSTVNICLTKHDCDTFCSWYPTKDLHIHNLGIFEYKKVPNSIVVPKENSKIFVISGSLNFKQSNFPILDFINHYYKILHDKLPDWELKITGRNPSKEMQRACGNVISLVPNPNDISKEIASASVYICPIYAGSGLKLRIMDGLRQGLPILCHKNSVYGYEAIRDAGYLFEYHDEQSFMNALQTITSKHFDRQLIYKTYQSIFSFEVGMNRLRDILNKENLL